MNTMISTTSNQSFIEEPIEFIRIEESGKCHINPVAINMIESIQTKIAVIVVAGPYRTGKSFLLNRLLGR